jgi:putative colanic acid biosynthesis acetyltransferase WcaF
MISQDSDLCTGTHDHTDERLPLVAKPITVQAHTWICARAFVGPGVTVGSDAVVGACAVVFRDVPRGQIVGGNPARVIRSRDIVSGGDLR